MKIRRVYIKKSGGEIATEACYTAWKGFSAKGYPLDFFEPMDLFNASLVLDAETLVVGGTTTVHKALEQIGVTPPEPLNVPESLQTFAGRRLGHCTLADIRESVASGTHDACFIKPLRATKSFPGTVISTEAELDELSHLEDSLELQASEPIQIRSEWRFFVHHGNVAAVAHYAGNCFSFPDSECVLEAVRSYENAPVAYALDFGVTTSNATVLIEANDAFALGAYGVNPAVYAQMLEDRWWEITH